MNTGKPVTKALVHENGIKILISIPVGATLSDVLELVERAVRACGFHFDGIIDVVKGEDDEGD